MDVQTPHAAPAGLFSPAKSQSTPRSGPEGTRRDLRESGQSFSSELRNARGVKEPRQEASRSRTDQKAHDEEHEERDTAMSSDEDAAPASASPHSSCSRREDHSCDSTSDPSQQKTDNVAAPAVNDVATQSVLLALIAQPVVPADTPAPGMTSSAEQGTAAMESVMPSVKEDGASLPVMAADSSIILPKEPEASLPQPADPTPAIPSAAGIPPSVEPATPLLVSSQEAPIVSGAIRPVQGEHPDDLQNKPVLPLDQKEQSHDPVKAEANLQPVARPDERPVDVSVVHEIVTPSTAEPVQRTEDNRPLAMERPVAKQDAPEPKEDSAPHQLSAGQVAWQGSADQERESGTNWNGQDHRERPSSDQAMAHAAPLEPSAPATPPVSLIPAHTPDQRAFPPASSAKLPVEAQPGVTVPAASVQPTDWMPGNVTSQTKSMVLELSQEDLGRVNIRVAVNQDVVHTHFMSDRSDMGQYLQSGQEKLQSALQMSGLDLGRFQVDIDRQSAGRSFQDQTSQGQQNGRMPQQDAQGQHHENEESHQRAIPRRGMLNLVA